MSYGYVMIATAKWLHINALYEGIARKRERELDKWCAFGGACEARAGGSGSMSTWECKQNGGGRRGDWGVANAATLEPLI